MLHVRKHSKNDLSFKGQNSLLRVIANLLSGLSGHRQFLSGFPVPPPHSRLFTNIVFYVSRLIKLLSSYAKKLFLDMS